MSESKKRLIRNTAILTVTSLALRAIGMGFNAYLASRVGAEGVGLFQLLLSLYFMAVTLASSGLRLAAVRLNSEALAQGRSPRRILSGCVRSSGVMGVAAMLLLFALSEQAAQLLGTASAVFPLRILALSLPFVAMSSSLGGYFTARRKVAALGAIQVLEQALRVGLTVLALGALPPGGEYALLAIAFGMTGAEGFSFACLFICCVIDIRASRADSGGGVLRCIARIALPDALGSYLRSALGTAEQLLIPKQLEKAGPGGLETYGLIRGMAMPLLTLPSALVGALAGLLVPELAQMRILGQHQRVARTVRRTLFWTFAYSSAVALVLFLAAKPLSEAIYHGAEAAFYVRALAPLIPMLYVDSVTDQMLRGLDQQVYCVRINTIDCALRLLIVFFFIPYGGSAGYIALIYGSEALNFALSITKLLRVSGAAENVRLRSTPA